MHFSFSLSHDILFCALFCNIDIVLSSLLTIENFVIAEYRGMNSESGHLRLALPATLVNESGFNESEMHVKIYRFKVLLRPVLRSS